MFGVGSTDIIMHHYRSREDETSCSGGGGSDPYFYLRLSAGAAPYNPIKLEVDVKPESCMTSVVCLEQQQRQGSPSDAVVMDTTGCDGVVCKDEPGTTGIGLLALTQLDGYGGYKSYCDVTGGDGVISSTDDLLHDRIGDIDDHKDDKYSYSRLIYSSSDDIKHQVYSKLLFPLPSP